MRRAFYTMLGIRVFLTMRLVGFTIAISVALGTACVVVALAIRTQLIILVYITDATLAAVLRRGTCRTATTLVAQRATIGAISIGQALRARCVEVLVGLLTESDTLAFIAIRLGVGILVYAIFMPTKVVRRALRAIARGTIRRFGRTLLVLIASGAMPHEAMWGMLVRAMGIVLALYTDAITAGRRILRNPNATCISALFCGSERIYWTSLANTES